MITSNPTPPTSEKVVVPEKGESPGRIAAYLGVGAVLIYIGTWSPALAFWWSFQRPVEAARPETPSVLWSRPYPSPPATTAPAWQWLRVEDSDWLLPPGAVERPTLDGEDGRRLVAEVDGHQVVTRRFPRSFVTEMLASDLEHYGGSVPLRTEVETLEAVASTTPDDYRLGASKEERAVYTAHLLGKMRLWDDSPHQKFASAQVDDDVAILVSYEDGSVKLLATRGEEVHVAFVTKGAPPAWSENPVQALRAAE